jgi:hypothetical protein
MMPICVSESENSELFGVSQTKVRKATDELAHVTRQTVTFS